LREKGLSVDTAYGGSNYVFPNFSVLLNQTYDSLAALQGINLSIGSMLFLDNILIIHFVDANNCPSVISNPVYSQIVISIDDKMNCDLSVQLKEGIQKKHVDAKSINNWLEGFHVCLAYAERNNLTIAAVHRQANINETKVQIVFQ